VVIQFHIGSGPRCNESGTLRCAIAIAKKATYLLRRRLAYFACRAVIRLTAIQR
jgi:hypothetical protein